MSPRIWTIGILVAVAVLLIGWDVYAATNKERDDTISEVVLGFARRHPVTPLSRSFSAC